MHTNSSKNFKIGLLQKIHNKIRFNLIFQVIRNCLASIGFDFIPYILFQENINETKFPVIKGNISDYKVECLDEADLKIIGSNIRGYSVEGFLSSLKNGKKCIGVKYKEEIVAFVWFDFDECNFKSERFKLKKNEAYSYSLYTMEHFRGRNIAPYLKYRSYKILKKMGIDMCYSISEYFNSSSLKYRKKLNPKKLKFVLYIRLFKKLEWKITLKLYK